MTVSSKCNIGELIESRATRIIRKLKRNHFCRGSWFVITTAVESTEILYVLSKRELQSGLYPFDKLKVLGISGSRQEAFSLVTKMIQEAYNADSIFHLKKYFMEY